MKGRENLSTQSSGRNKGLNGYGRKGGRGTIEGLEQLWIYGSPLMQNLQNEDITVISLLCSSESGSLGILDNKSFTAFKFKKKRGKITDENLKQKNKN